MGEYQYPSSRKVMRILLRVVLIVFIVVVVIIWSTMSGLFDKGVNHSFDLGSDDNTIVFSADGRGGSGIFLMSLTSGRVSTVIDSDNHERTPCLSPDGKLICYSSSEKMRSSANIYQCRLDGSQIVRLTNQTNKYDCDPCFCPNQSHIVFARANVKNSNSFGGISWSDWDIWALELRTGKETQLTHKAYFRVSGPSVTNSGKSVIFSAYSTGDSEIFSVPLDGSRPPEMIVSNGYSANPSASKWDNTLVFISDRNSKNRNDRGLIQYEIWKIDIQYGTQSEVTSLKSYLNNPRAFATGHIILFLNDPHRTGEMELWKTDPSIGKSTRIADKNLFHSPLNWHSK